MKKVLDTVVLQSPDISEELALKIEEKSVTIEKVNHLVGRRIYKMSSHQLEGSFDYRIRLNVKRERWVVTEQNRKPCKVQSEPYLEVEGSLQKFVYGHNVMYAVEKWKEAVDFFLDGVTMLLDNALGMDGSLVLPDYSEWEVCRVDVSANYNLGSPEAVEEYINELKTMYYPRRNHKKGTFQGEFDGSVNWPAKANILKVYDKGKEFKAHDKKRLCKILSDVEMKKVQETASCTLRVELGMRKHYLRELYGEKGRAVKVKDLNEDLLYPVFEAFVASKLKGGVAMECVRTSDRVLERLVDVYGKRKGRNMHGAWMMLATHGELYVREQYSKATFCRYMADLRAANVAWYGTDMKKLSYDEKRVTAIPEGFFPSLSSPYRIGPEECPRYLDGFRMAM